MKLLLITGAFAVAALVSGCATTSEPPTPEQRAACEKMLAMGEGATHSHATDKTGVVNTMGLTHAQCRRMLAK